MTDLKENWLLVAVEDLTKPDKRPHVQNILENGVPIGTQSSVIVLPPLLTQLDAAIRSSMGGAQSTGSALAFEGAILDVGALFTAVKISTQIRDWCRIAKVPSRKDSRRDLIAWYLKVGEIPFESERFHLRMLRSWAAQIREILNPARERELPNICPVCEANEWWDKRDGRRYLHPLIVRYRATDADMIRAARGMCRACEETWGVRELAYILEHTSDDDTPQSA